MVWSSLVDRPSCFELSYSQVSCGVHGREALAAIDKKKKGRWSSSYQLVDEIPVSPRQDTADPWDVINYPANPPADCVVEHQPVDSLASQMLQTELAPEPLLSSVDDPVPDAVSKKEQAEKVKERGQIMTCCLRCIRLDIYHREG